ncbi:MAG: hypothetical protein VKL39_03785, partial [Leptolyngbyaceae bacterium]|nr:hypothetical protein [Leptolyngbyaceae bacterium]
MKKVTQILLRAYLRRYPARFRLSQFNFLSKYSWIKNVLEDLRPEFFPPLDDEGADVEGVPFDAVPRNIIHPLEGREIRGDRGTYRMDTFQYARGNGLIFSGVQLESNQPVTIKVYRLEHAFFSEADIRDRQQAFESLAGLKLADERDHDFRVRCPIEAIADASPISADDGRHGAHCCYLMTDGHDADSLTLAEAIAQRHAFPPATVRRVLEQILQTLAFLHQQRYTFPSGQTQTGVIHG